MIYYSTPYRNDKDIGKYYNNFMELLGDDDWACFIDGDAMFTTPYFGSIIEDYIDEYPDMGMFTAKTNRVLNWPQLHNFKMSENFNMKYHFEIGEKRAKGNRGITILDRTTPVSGVVMLISKKAWSECRFREGKPLGVDNEMHYCLNDLGKKVAVMEDLYVLHWYRGFDYKDKSHLL